MKAIWNGHVVADSDETVVVEGNHYFPPNSVQQNFLRKSETHSTCHWKGEASYYDVVVGDDINTEAAWYYPKPKPAADNIVDHVAFWKGVEIVD